MVDPIQAGSTIAGYQLEAVIGRGGMGVVYRAHQPELGRQVAIKLIAPALARDEGFRERFRRESRLAAAIEHPNAIPIYGAGVTDEGVLYLAMRYIEGTDLSTLIRKEGRLDPTRAARIIDQVAGALDEAHARGLVHRDVKPGNVLVSSGGGMDHTYLTDFGLTKQASATSGLTATGQWVGTVDYAPPEQLEGRRLDARADVYSLGCVFFEALTGGVPFPKDTQLAKLFAHANEPAPVPSRTVPELLPELDGVVERAMRKQPDDRFPSAGDLGRAALAAAAGRRVAAPERTVAAGEAARGGSVIAPPTLAAETDPTAPKTMPAPGAEAAATVPAPPVGEASEAPARPGSTEAEPTRTLAAEAGPVAEPGATRRLPTERTARGRRRLLTGLAGVAVLVAATGAAFGLGWIGGDGGSDTDSPRFETATTPPRFETATTSAFTVEVPAGWVKTQDERSAKQGTVLRSMFESPAGAMLLGINRRPAQFASPGEQAQRFAEEAAAGEVDDYERIRLDLDVSLNGRQSAIWEFSKTDRILGPDSRAVTYFLLDGSRGEVRIQVNGASSVELSELRQISRRAATTLEFD